ncbi:MAG: mechanosensitive ion channel family protein [Candidatus Harrisonbacteria bacterium]|nr:mechanosensitive ion channel family protein [Candidatus Harrisonbacteria bacterium]
MEEILFTALSVFVEWVSGSGLRVLVIVVAALVVLRFGRILIEKLIRKIVVADSFLDKTAEKKRENTLIKAFGGALRIGVLLIAFLMALSELGLNVGPILAAAGVAGLAIGFGGQYLIRDLISGLFILMENQFRVGDVVCVNGTCGLVEDINLRRVIMRDLDGTVHNIPNGEIKIASNLSKEFARVNLDIGVSYDSDLAKVMKVVNKVGSDLANDPDWKIFIIKAPQFLRVDNFADSAIIIKILGETEPLKQWDVTGELRKRLKIAFDKEGIEIPFPQRVVRQVK